MMYQSFLNFEDHWLMQRIVCSTLYSEQLFVMISLQIIQDKCISSRQLLVIAHWQTINCHHCYIKSSLLTVFKDVLEIVLLNLSAGSLISLHVKRYYKLSYYVRTVLLFRTISIHLFFLKLDIDFNTCKVVLRIIILRLGNPST